MEPNLRLSEIHKVSDTKYRAGGAYIAPFAMCARNETAGILRCAQNDKPASTSFVPWAFSGSRRYAPTAPIRLRFRRRTPSPSSRYIR